MVRLLEKKDNLVVIGDYLNILPGYAFSSKKFSHEKKGLPLIRIRDIESKETDCYFDGEYPEEYLVKKGDILIGMDGEFNTCIWQGEKALLNQRVCKIFPKNDSQLDKDYLYYIIQKPLKIIELTVGQTTVKHLSTKDFFKIQVPLPSLLEQKRIAEILSTIDKKLELQKARKEKIERVKKGLMDELLTGKKRVNVEKILGDEK